MERGRNSRCEDAIAVVARKMSEETQLPPPQWREWCSSLERLHAALATVCVLFAQREAPTTLRSLRAAVERMAQLPLDATTLRLLQRVHGADEIGLDALGDDDIAVKLRLEKPGGAKRKRPDADASTSQQRRQRAPFSSPRASSAGGARTTTWSRSSTRR